MHYTQEIIKKPQPFNVHPIGHLPVPVQISQLSSVNYIQANASTTMAQVTLHESLSISKRLLEESEEFYL